MHCKWCYIFQSIWCLVSMTDRRLNCLSLVATPPWFKRTFCRVWCKFFCPARDDTPIRQPAGFSLITGPIKPLPVHNKSQHSGLRELPSAVRLCVAWRQAPSGRSCTRYCRVNQPTTAIILSPPPNKRLLQNNESISSVKRVAKIVRAPRQITADDVFGF